MLPPPDGMRLCIRCCAVHLHCLNDDKKIYSIIPLPCRVHIFEIEREHINLDYSNPDRTRFRQQYRAHTRATKCEYSILHLHIHICKWNVPILKRQKSNWYSKLIYAFDFVMHTGKSETLFCSKSAARSRVRFDSFCHSTHTAQILWMGVIISDNLTNGNASGNLRKHRYKEKTFTNFG